MNAEGVTNIVKYYLKPDIKNYFDQLIKDGSLQKVKCHQSFEYPAAVTNQKCWPYFGIFFDYLVRREIYVLLKQEAFDKRAEMFRSARIDQSQICEGETLSFNYEDEIKITLDHDDIGKVRKFLAGYKIFRNIEYRSIDKLEDIYNTSMLHMMSYGKPIIPYDPDFINMSNIEDVLEYVKTWNLKNIKINPKVRGKYFHGDADLIFHDSLMEMKVSKDDDPQCDNSSTFKQGLYQMIIYALGFYIETDQEIRTFKIYNPLRGVMHVFNLPSYLDFAEFHGRVDDEPCWKK